MLEEAQKGTASLDRFKRKYQQFAHSVQGATRRVLCEKDAKMTDGLDSEPVSMGRRDGGIVLGIFFRMRVATPGCRFWKCERRVQRVLTKGYESKV